MSLLNSSFGMVFLIVGSTASPMTGGSFMNVSEFGIKFSGPYIEKLKIAFRLMSCSFSLIANRDVTVVIDKACIKSCELDQ